MSTKGVKTVTNISNLLATYSVSNESVTSLSRPWISGKCWNDQCWNCIVNFIVELAKMFSEKQPSKFSLDPVLDLGPTVPFQGPLIRKQASVGRPKMSRPRSVLVPSRPEDEQGWGPSEDVSSPAHEPCLDPTFDFVLFNPSFASLSKINHEKITWFYLSETNSLINSRFSSIKFRERK